MKNLTEKKCVPCEGGTAALTLEAARDLLKQIPHWQIDAEGRVIYRSFEFKNFFRTMSFVNAVAWIANEENHHPNMEVSFNRCTVKYSTHAINGLSENDFICAAKINALI